MDNSTSPASYSTTPNAIFLPICAALVTVATYVPLLLLVRVKKVAACTLVITLAVQNVFTFLNAILWPNNNTTEWYNGVGLCDVQVTIKVPLSTLLATSAAYISRDLAKALDADNPNLHESRKMRRRRLAVEILFVFGIPILQVVLHYIPQASRFGVVTIYGCADFLDDSWPALVILAIWPPIFALLNCYYAVLVMHRLRKHRGALSSTLSSTGSGFNSRRFVKLFFLSASILVVYLPITLYFLYINVDYPYTTYSWSRVHNPATWDPILFVTTATVPRVQYWGWIGIVMAGIVVFLYGMSREAAEIYKGWLIKCGFSKIFPGLLRPREFPTNRRGSSSRGSWIARFDLVTRVMHYCDGVRKGSQAPEWDTTHSRKGSEATFEHVNSPGSKSFSTVATVELGSTTLAPSSSQAVMTPSPAAQLPDLNQQPLFFTSPYRTHSNLPYFIFSLKKTAPPAADSIELQSQTLNNTLGSVETNIWSNADSDDDLDPLAPRMGTRAYREREKRFHEQGDVGRGVIADTVTVDFGVSRGMKDGVKVERKLERIEEVTALSSA